MISPPADVGGYNDGYTNDPIWTGQATKWLHQHAADEQPWMCVLSLLNPHDIQFYPRGFRVDFKRPDYGAKPEKSFYANPTLDGKPSAQAKFRDVVATIAGTPKGEWDEPEYWRGQLNTYYDLIVGNDEMLGAAIKEVIDAGALDDTVIVRTADHGELGSAHRLQNKGTTMYDEQNRVPFTVVYPKRFKEGKRSEALGEAVDLVPTLLELAGELDPTDRWPWLRGVSLVSALEDPDSSGPRKSILYRIDEYPVTNVGTAVPTASHIRAIFDGRYKFARYVPVKDQHFAGEELLDQQEYELYDTWEDPYEIRNLASDPAYGKLRSDMLAWLYERERAEVRACDVPGLRPACAHHEDPGAAFAQHRQERPAEPVARSEPAGRLLQGPDQAADSAALPLRGRPAALDRRQAGRRGRGRRGALLLRADPARLSAGAFAGSSPDRRAIRLPFGPWRDGCDIRARSRCSR